MGTYGWWIVLIMWIITPILTGLSLLTLPASEVISHLLARISHQVGPKCPIVIFSKPYDLIISGLRGHLPMGHPWPLSHWCAEIPTVVRDILYGWARGLAGPFLLDLFAPTTFFHKARMASMTRPQEISQLAGLENFPE